MSQKLTVTILVVALLLLATPVLAGGWVVVTVDSLPGEVRAGEEVQIGLMVRQHGTHPISNVSPQILATHAESGEEVRVDAEASKETGHFVATVAFPAEGEWIWSITVPEFEHTAEQASLTVLPAVKAAPVEMDAPATAPVSLASMTQTLLRWSGVVLLLVSVLLFVRDARRRPNAAVTSAGD